MLNFLVKCLLLVTISSKFMRRQAGELTELEMEGGRQACCRCVSSSIGCNIPKTKPPKDVAECEPQPECFLFPKDEFSVNLVDLRTFEMTRSDCPSGEELCCDSVDPGLVQEAVIDFDLRGVGAEFPFVEANNPIKLVDQTRCKAPALVATENFGFGQICGKRDFRSYKHVDQPEGFTNPGEWPWAVLIYHRGEYLGAGGLVGQDVVVTVGHKLLNVENPEDLTVRLGDWDPNTANPKEEFDYVELTVSCFNIHPQADLFNSLMNNVAILKLRKDSSDDEYYTYETTDSPVTADKTVKSVIELRGANEDRGPGKVEPSYINTVCLPDPEQFTDYSGNCWVAAWGKYQERQREVDLPLLSREECNNRLQPTFALKGLPNWVMKDSEICAGGIAGKDTCFGEGGAPLVCLDQSKNQFFAVGLVGYGFSCNTTTPAVYTNLADPVVREFIDQALFDSEYCSRLIG